MGQVYMDVVYNHTGEGGTWDATGECVQEVCFHGLDNASYYTLAGAGNNNFYWTSTGCGNNFNTGSAPVQKLVTDSLAYWANSMGVDGFRFDEGAELGRNGSANFSSSSTMLTSIASLAASDNFKVIAEPWDCNDGGEIGNFPIGWACWNGNYRDTVREYMTGSLAGESGIGYADAFYGDYSAMNIEGGPQKSVNMIDCHDGFVLTDLVSYASNTNTSVTWPFGPSDGGITSNNSSSWGLNQSIRRQVIRDFWTFQVLSRGVPMIEYGDEFGRTANGNNNPYDVDSVATWNNYNMIPSNAPNTVATGDATGGSTTYNNNLGTFSTSNNANFVFLQQLLKLKAAHPAFNQSNYTMAISYYNANFTTGFSEWSNPSVGIYVSGTQVGDSDFYILCNMSGSSVSYTVPAAPTGTQWVRLIDTNSWAEPNDNCWSSASGTVISGNYGVGNQSIVVLQAVSGRS